MNWISRTMDPNNNHHPEICNRINRLLFWGSTGVGRLENVVLGTLFISLVQNTMNLVRIESYLQTVVISLLLIIAVIVDQARLRIMANLQD